jgi:type II secretion system protein I
MLSLARRGARRGHPSARDSGFTLIEMMVAVVLLAVGITAMMRAVNSSTMASAQARDQVLAATLAQQVMNELIQNGVENGGVTEGSDSGDFGTEYPGYHYETTVEQSPDVTGLDQITVTVLWPSGGPQERHYDLATLYLPPSTETTTDSNGGTNAGIGGVSSGG